MYIYSPEGAQLRYIQKNKTIHHFSEVENLKDETHSQPPETLAAANHNVRRLVISIEKCGALPRSLVCTLARTHAERA